ncbi:unnamed protein product [Timema podura]|uniref:Uncharacterized protein n=1 Tax=Timema podura TaxID=61482 RepID=A0ABN7P8F7_TIMPD|nr:unnamed protein product [Timema podura]
MDGPLGWQTYVTLSECVTLAKDEPEAAVAWRHHSRKHRVLMYFIVVVHSYRVQLKSNRVQDVERFPASYVTSKKSLAIPQRRGKYPSNDFY